MESMIKIDNGVSKKAMDEVAEVAERLFKAAHTYDIDGANLGVALNMVGKTIKSGKVNISHCNLTTTLERNGVDEEPNPALRNENPAVFPGRENMQRKLEILQTLAANSGFRMDVFPDEERVEINSHTPGLMEANLTYEFIAYMPDDDLHHLIPKMFGKVPDNDQEG